MDPSAIQKLASLAKLELSEEEGKAFPGQLVSILEYVEKLKELELPADARQMAHAVELVNVWREDEPEEISDEDRQALIEAFPKRVGRLNSVPAVFGNPDV